MGHLSTWGALVGCPGGRGAAAEGMHRGGRLGGTVVLVEELCFWASGR